MQEDSPAAPISAFGTWEGIGAEVATSTVHDVDEELTIRHDSPPPPSGGGSEDARSDPSSSRLKNRPAASGGGSAPQQQRRVSIHYDTRSGTPPRVESPSPAPEEVQPLRQRKAFVQRRGTAQQQQDQSGTDVTVSAPRTQRDLVNPRWSYLGDIYKRSLRRNDYTGQYYYDVNENHFTALITRIKTATHPDRALRDIGLIKQVGRQGHSVFYDVRIRRWREKETHRILTKVKEADLSDREDYVPSGLIHIVGYLPIEQIEKDDHAKEAQRQLASEELLQTVSEKRRGEEGVSRRQSMAADLASGFRRRSETESQSSPAITPTHGHDTQDPRKGSLLRQPLNLNLRLRGPQSADPHMISARPTPRQTLLGELGWTGYDLSDDCDKNFEKSLIEVGDPSPEFLSAAEQLRYVRHYLTRGVCLAAKESGASILTSCNCIDSDISRLLGVGYAYLLDRQGAKNQRNAVYPQLIGIHRHFHPYLDLNFSHQIVLEAGGSHQLVLRGSTCSLCGKMVSPEERYNPCPKADNRPGPVSVKELSRFKHGLIEALQKGFQRDLLERAKDAPPNRPAVPIVVLLVGGDLSAQEDVHRAVVKGWPVLVVEGSGGFADVICSVRKGAERIAPDDLKTALANVDPKIADIASNGRLIIIPKGTEVKRFQRILQDSLKGDEILMKAWKQYTIWYSAETRWAYYHRFCELVVLVLGILTTGVSVALTFLKLLWQSEGNDYPDRWSNLGAVKASEIESFLLFSALEWGVIIIPILLSLAIAIQHRMNPWSKVSALRIAASSLLKNIYLYRTQTLGYSTEAIRRQQKKEEERQSIRADPLMLLTVDRKTLGEGGSSEGGVGEESSADDLDILTAGLDPYFSREELLGQMLVRIQKEVIATEVKSVTLNAVPRGPVPPTEILDLGDTGFHDLTPDEYVKFRLAAQRLQFTAKAEADASIYSYLVTGSYVWSAIGTSIAALSAYGLTYMQAFISLTTSLVDSHYRFVDFSRMASLTELSNTTVHRLSEVEGWWAALGSKRDSSQSKNKLVQMTEAILQDELEGWARQLQRSAAEERDAQKEAERERDEARAREEAKRKEMEAKLTELGIECMTTDFVAKAIEEFQEGRNAVPGTTTLQTVRKQLLVLNERLGGVLKVEEQGARMNKDDQLRGNANEWMALLNLEAPPEATKSQMGDSQRSGKDSAQLDPNNSPAKNDPEDDQEGRREELGDIFVGEAAVLKNKFKMVVNDIQIGAALQDPKLQSHFVKDWKRVGCSFTTATAFMVSCVIGEYSKAYAVAIDEALTDSELIIFAKAIVVSGLVRILEAHGWKTPPELRDVFISQLTFAIPDDENPLEDKATFIRYIKHPKLKDMLFGCTPHSLRRLQIFCRAIFSPDGTNIGKHAVRMIGEQNESKEAHHWDDDEAVVRRLTAKGPETTADGREYYQLYIALCNALARNDFSLATEDPEIQRLHVAGLPQLEQAGSLDILTKGDILSFFDQQIQRSFLYTTRLRTLCFVDCLKIGPAEARWFDKVQLQYEEMVPGALDQISNVFHDRCRLEELLITSSELNNRFINRCDKGELIRRLRSNSVLREQTVTLINKEMGESFLKGFLSRLQAAGSNSYASALIDALADRIPLLDLRDMLSAEAKETIVMNVSYLPETVRLDRLSHRQLVALLSTDSNRRQFESLDREQLQTIVASLRAMIQSRYLLQVWETLSSAESSKQRLELVKLLEPPLAQRFLFVVGNLSHWDRQSAEDAKDVQSILKILSDYGVYCALIGRCNQAAMNKRRSVKLANELGMLVAEAHDALKDWRFHELWFNGTANWNGMFGVNGFIENEQLLDVLPRIKNALPGLCRRIPEALLHCGTSLMMFLDSHLHGDTATSDGVGSEHSYQRRGSTADAIVPARWKGLTDAVTTRKGLITLGLYRVDQGNTALTPTANRGLLQLVVSPPPAIQVDDLASDHGPAYDDDESIHRSPSPNMDRPLEQRSPRGSETPLPTGHSETNDSNSTTDKLQHWWSRISLQNDWLLTTLDWHGTHFVDHMIHSSTIHQFIHLPYVVFLELSHAIPELDLRDMITTPSDRFLVPYVLSFLYADHHHLFALPTQATRSVAPSVLSRRSAADTHMQLGTHLTTISPMSDRTATGAKSVTSALSLTHINSRGKGRLSHRLPREDDHPGDVALREEVMRLLTDSLTEADAAQWMARDWTESSGLEMHSPPRGGVHHRPSPPTATAATAFAQLAATHHAANKPASDNTRKNNAQFIHAEEDQLYFETVVASLRLLTSRQLRLLLQRARTLFMTTELGRTFIGLSGSFFFSPLRDELEGREYPTLGDGAHPAFSVLHIAYVLQSVLRCDTENTVLNAFHQFEDIEGFLQDCELTRVNLGSRHRTNHSSHPGRDREMNSRSPKTGATKLYNCLPDDRLVEQILQFTRPQIELLFWVMGHLIRENNVAQRLSEVQIAETGRKPARSFAGGVPGPSQRGTRSRALDEPSRETMDSDTPIYDD